jgi:hypothetical protein
MEIDNGLNKLTNAHKRSASAEATSARQWRDLKNKIDSILKSGSKKTDEIKTICVTLENEHHDNRCRIISEYFGVQYLNKVMPLLQQLKNLEDKS